MSQIKSAMQIQGILVKQMHHNCYHVSIQPCYDKKIESFRGTDVDLILTPKEIIQFLEEQKVQLLLLLY